jgi:hypothetical protein
MRIYAKLGVPEVWRLRDGVITFSRLSTGAYAVTSHSLSFPFLTAADLLPFLQQAIQAQDENTVIRAFRNWVQQRQTPPLP